jgi:transposase
LELAPPDHSTIARTRRLIDLETHQAVFTWMLQRVSDAGLLKGRTMGVDATTLEANAISSKRKYRLGAKLGRPIFGA